MLAKFIFAVLTCVLVVATATPGYAQKRVALVIGINDYPKLKTPEDPTEGQLLKAIADAETMASVLAKLGFDVQLARNVDRIGFLTAIDSVKRKLTAGDTFFFFFAGHGVAFRGSNLLLPADVPPVDPESEALVRGVAIAETDVIAAARDGGVALTVLALDACRNNPIEDFRRKQARTRGQAFRSSNAMRSVGLVGLQASGVFSIYSAGIDQRAVDSAGDKDENRNSVFTRVFARKLGEPGRHLGDVMEEVREEVALLAATLLDDKTQKPHQQHPAYYNETRGGRIYLAGRPSEKRAEPESPSKLGSKPQPDPQPQATPPQSDSKAGIVKDLMREVTFDVKLKNGRSDQTPTVKIYRDVLVWSDDEGLRNSGRSLTCRASARMAAPKVGSRACSYTHDRDSYRIRYWRSWETSFGTTMTTTAVLSFDVRESRCSVLHYENDTSLEGFITGPSVVASATCQVAIKQSDLRP